MTFLFAHKKKYIAAQWMLGGGMGGGDAVRRTRDGGGEGSAGVARGARGWPTLTGQVILLFTFR